MDQCRHRNSLARQHLLGHIEAPDKNFPVIELRCFEIIDNDTQRRQFAPKLRLGGGITGEDQVAVPFRWDHGRSQFERLRGMGNAQGVGCGWTRHVKIGNDISGWASDNTAGVCRNRSLRVVGLRRYHHHAGFRPRPWPRKVGDPRHQQGQRYQPKRRQARQPALLLCCQNALDSQHDKPCSEQPKRPALRPPDCVNAFEVCGTSARHRRVDGQQMGQGALSGAEQPNLLGNKILLGHTGRWSSGHFEVDEGLTQQSSIDPAGHAHGAACGWR